MEARAEARLRQLLTGKASAPKPSPPAYAGPPAPFARVLARYFPLENRDGRLSAEVSVLSFGGREEDTKRIGAFDIDRALRDQQGEACALCDDVVNIHGGGIAIGHPIGASGNRLVVHAVHELVRRGGGTAAVALCGGGGQGDALILTR